MNIVVKLLENYENKTVKEFIDDSFFLFDQNDALESQCILRKDRIILPLSCNRIILSIALWFSSSLSDRIDKNFLTPKISRTFKKLRDAIITDAIIKYSAIEYAPSLWESKASQLPSKVYTLDFTNIRKIIENSALVNPLIASIDLPSVKKKAEKNFKDIIKSLNPGTFEKLYPAIFIHWLCCFDPNLDIKNDNVNFESKCDLMLAMLIGPVKDQDQFEYSLDQRIRVKIIHEIRKATLESLHECKKYYSILMNSDCNEKCNYKNNEMYKCINILYDKMLKNGSIVSDIELFNIDNVSFDGKIDSINEIRANYKNVFTYRTNLFWNALYAEFEKRKKKTIRLHNLQQFHSLFSNTSFLKSDYTMNLSPSKTYCMLSLNNTTHWIDLLIINNGLPLNAIDIDGIYTKSVMADIINFSQKISNTSFSYSEINFLQYQDDNDRNQKYFKGDVFEARFTNDINRIIKILITSFCNGELTKEQIQKCDRKYNDLYNKLFNEKKLLYFPTKTLIELSKKEYDSDNEFYLPDGQDG